METSEVLDLLRESGALLEGHFELSSGLHSNRYFQCALALCDPKRAEVFANGLASKLPYEVDLVVGHLIVRFDKLLVLLHNSRLLSLWRHDWVVPDLSALRDSA